MPESSSPRFRWTWVFGLLAVAVALRAGWTTLRRTPEPAAPAAAGAVHDGALEWVPVHAAEAAAQSRGVPILYDFNAGWCPPCKRMTSEVFANPRLAAEIQAQVVPVSVVDRYREDGANPPEVDALQRRFEIRAFPTLVLVSPDGATFEKLEGYAGPGGTMDWVRQTSRSLARG